MPADSNTNRGNHDAHTCKNIAAAYIYGVY